MKNIVFGLFLSFVGAAYAETLQDALVGAYNGDELNAARKRVLSNNEKSSQAAAAFLPTITGTLTGQQSRTTNGGDAANVRNPLRNNFGTKKQNSLQKSAGVTIKQNLFKSFGDYAKFMGAKDANRAVWAELSVTEQKHFLRVVELYCNIIAKTKEIEFLKSNNSFLTKQFESTHDKFKVGEETITNVSSAEADLAGGIAKAQASEAELQGLKARYEFLIGRTASKFAKPTLPASLPISLGKAMDIAKAQHPEILKANYDFKNAEYTVNESYAGHGASLDLQGSYTRSLKRTKATNTRPMTVSQNDSSNDTSVSLQLSVPLFAGGATQSRVREAREAAQSKKIALAKVRAEIVAGVISAWETFKAAEANLKNYQKQIDARALSVQSLQQEKDAGSKTLLDVLKGQKDLLEAQRQFVESEKIYYVSAYQLLAAVGELSATKLKLPVDVFDPQKEFDNKPFFF